MLSALIFRMGDRKPASRAVVRSHRHESTLRPGRWRAHLRPRRTFPPRWPVCLFILPTGAQRFEKLLPPGLVCTFDQTLEGAFAGTSQAVVFLLAVRAS